MNLAQIIKTWKNHTFSTGMTTGEDFKLFAKDFREFVKSALPENAKLVEYNTGHYYVSGFIEKNGKYIYFSIPDVRFFPNEWMNNILIRTAKNPRDYYGGANNYTTIWEFKYALERMFNRML